jgi:hypothetical protein
MANANNNSSIGRSCRRERFERRIRRARRHTSLRTRLKIEKTSSLPHCVNNTSPDHGAVALTAEAEGADEVLGVGFKARWPMTGRTSISLHS